MSLITYVTMMCLAVSSTSFPPPLHQFPSHPQHSTSFPSSPEPPAPSQSYPEPPAPSQSYPEPPAPSQSSPEPPAPSQSYPEPPAPSQSYPEPPAPSQSYSEPSTPSPIPSEPRAGFSFSGRPPTPSFHSELSAAPTSKSPPAVLPPAPHFASASYGLPSSYFSFASYNQPHFADEVPKYSYNYGVADDHSGVNFGHSESRDGHKTEGSYTVDLPDGRRQTVKYVDNGDGYKANVVYEGEVLRP